jgi:hypothetical protein
MDSPRRKKVLCPLERNGKTYWLRIGTAFVNKDGSTNVLLDAYPSNQKLHIRDLDERDLEPRRRRDGESEGGFAAQPQDDVPF